MSPDPTRHLALALAISLHACATADVAADAPPDLAYSIELADLDPPRVRIHLTTTAAASGNTVLALRAGDSGEPGGGEDFAELEVRGDDQRECYKPLLTASFFHLIGNRGLLTPEHLDDGQPLDVVLAWRGFAERGWNVACSFGDDARVVRVHRPLSDVQNALFVAAPLPFERRSVRGNAVTVALLDSGWKADASELADLCARIVQTERDFFDDHACAHFLISAVAFGAADPHSHSLGGTGLTDSFALFLQRGADLTPGAPLRAPLERVLSHEMLHNWCGRLTPPAEPERLVYWFSEGFTDFFTRRVMLRGGLIDVDGYAESFQASARDYLSNPHCRAPNAMIDESFWEDRYVGELPYRRGDLVAALLDGEIRRRSLGAQSADDFLREAVALGREGERVTTAVLIARIARWTDAAFAERLRGIVEDGDVVELPADLFAPCLEIALRDVPSLDPGFDVQATIDARELKGVRVDSAAARAGLRDGQKLGSLSYEGRADRPVSLEVLEDGVRRKFEFLPLGPPRPMPCVEVVAREGCAGL